MMILKKILKSNFFKILISVVLLYFAFRRVNILNILNEIKQVPFWFIVVNLIYVILTVILGSFRWSLILFREITFKEIINFTKASYSGVFYSLFFPTGVVGDLIKWLPLQKEYPDLTKTKLLSSALLDRVIGFTAFIMLATFSAIIGKLLRFQFPEYLLWLFSFLFIGVIVFYIVIWKIDMEKVVSKFPILSKLNQIIDLLKNENKKRLLQCFFVSIFTEFIWIFQVWFISQFFHAGFSILSVFIFMPVIALILLLPISVAGFGAREQLYLFFFSQVGHGDEKILLVSTFLGVMGIVNALLGGLWLLTSNFKASKM